VTNRKRVLRVAIATAGMAMLSLWLTAAPRVPRRINDVKPIYPPESLKRGDEGAMLFELSVDASGAVQDALMLWSGCERLEKAALVQYVSGDMSSGS
jgi:outer membrane biosynthesis protein TonB